MSLLWELTHKETHYSVRNSGGSVRLYTNRVFHSQWNPKMPFAGGIWDCLSLPALHKSPGQIRRVLLLGVGGGAVIRQLQTIGDYDQIMAIEIDKQHLTIARDWFDVRGENLTLVHDDAIDWLYRYQGKAFDLIIDDLFGHDEGEPVRACPLEPRWLECLTRHLNPDGLLVVNCINSRELVHALPVIGASGFRAGYRWHLPTYENVIGVFSTKPIHARDWSRNLEFSSLKPKAQRQARTIIRRPVRGLGLYKD
ncbi:MAG: spermidine synthase [Granulosicoccus sp.]